MNTVVTQSPRSLRLSMTKMGHVLGVVLTILISIVTGLNWQAGLTLTLVSGYILLVSLRLEWGIYAIVAFTVLCIDGWTPNRSPEDVVFRLSVGHIYITEFAVYGLLAAYFVKRAFGKRAVGVNHFFEPTPLDVPLKVFAALLPIFAVYGLALGNSAQEALGYWEWRTLFSAIVLYFLITTIIDTREKALRLFWWFLALDTFVGLYSLILYFLGSEGPFPFLLGAGPVGEGPENFTFMFAALCAISWLLFCREKYPWKRNLVLLAAIVPVLNVVLSEKRDPQIGLLVGLVVVTWRMPFRKKLKWGAATAGLGVMVLLFASVLGVQARSGGFEKSASRYTEILEFINNPSTSASVKSASMENTLAFHIFDMVDSFNSVRLRPVLGYGFGGHFVRVYTSLVGGDIVEPGIVHDQYLDFCVKMGAVGLLAFLWVLFRFVSFSFGTISKTPILEHDAISLGFLAAICADMMVEIWSTNWRSGTKMPIIFLFSFAVLVCLLRKPKRNSALSGRTE